MGDVAADLAQALHQDLNSVQHSVERARQAVQVVADAANRHPTREISTDNPFRGAGNGVNASKEGAAEQHATEDAEHCRASDRPQECRGDSLLEIIDLPEVLADREQNSI